VQQLAFAWLATGLFAVSLGYFLYTYLFTFSVIHPVGSPGGWRPVLINFSLFTIFALHHSLFARTRFKRLVTAIVPPALERAVYSLTASVLFLLVCAFWQPVSDVLYALSGPWRWIGYAAQAAGLVLTVASSRALDVLDLAGVRQVLTAQADDAADPHPLVTGGVYGLVRHPLYFGWALFVFGAPEMTMTRFTFAAISTAYLAIAIPFEEHSLVRTFGRDYEEYRRRVKWRMLPGLY
jgi:methanethiol S-methyltransferase